MCMKQSPSPSSEPRLIHRNVWNVDIGDGNKEHGFQYDQLTAPSSESTERDETNIMLKEIRDLLKTRVHKEEEQRYEDDKENEMRNDWILAAVILDRICAIVISVIYVVGSIVYFVYFDRHP